MGHCKQCGTFILWSGVKDDGDRYCNAVCHENGEVKRMAKLLPAEMVEEQVEAVHQGPCPLCQGDGPVDVHTQHTIWSALLVYKEQSTPHICCRGCGVKRQLSGLGSSFLLGWWSHHGFFLTPIQIFRNLGGLLMPPKWDEPSKQLRKLVKLNLSANVIDDAKRNPLYDERIERS